MFASLRRRSRAEEPFLRAAAQLSREPLAADRIPYTAHVSD
jgi:hypothetical protein